MRSPDSNLPPGHDQASSDLRRSRRGSRSALLDAGPRSTSAADTDLDLSTGSGRAPSVRGVPLVLDSQRSVTPGDRSLFDVGCDQPRRVWVASITSFARVPCKRWDCPRCGPRKARETARLLFLDAQADPPRYAITLTTRDPRTPASVYRQASAAVWKRLRRRYGRVDYFGFIEFTTGRGSHSGGHRRMHGHYLVKFRDAEPDVIEAEALIRSTWESVTGAYIVEVAQLVTPGAAFQYLSLHHQKPQQQPPKGWSGMRSRPSRGYFSEPVSVLRDRARSQLRDEAIEWAALRSLARAIDG